MTTMISEELKPFLESVLHTYQAMVKEMLASGILNGNRASTERENLSFVMTSHKSTTIGISIGKNHQGHRLVVYGQSNPILLNAIGHVSEQKLTEVSSYLAGLKNVSGDLVSVFYVPNEKPDYYDAAPLISVEYKINDSLEFDMDFVIMLHQSLLEHVKVIESKITPYC